MVEEHKNIEYTCSTCKKSYNIELLKLDHRVEIKKDVKDVLIV